MLGGAGVLNGLAAYAFVIIAVRGFGAAAFAPVAVVWSLWAIAIAGMSTPLQHWTIQTVRVTGSELLVRQGGRSLVGRVIAISLATTLVTWLARSSLFGTTDPVYPAVTGAVVATAGLAGYVRGVLGARDRFHALSGTLAADGVLRLALIALAVAVGLEVEAAAIAIPAATTVVVLWTSTFRLDTTPPSTAQAPPRLGALVLAFLLIHVALNAPPVLASTLGADPDVISSLFAAFSLFRAPFLIVSVIATRISFALAELVAAGRIDVLDRSRRLITGVTVIGMIAGAGFGTAPARWTLRLIYGPEVTLRAMEGPAIVAGSVASVGALVLVLLVAARGHARAVLIPLVLGTAVGIAWALLGPGAPGARVSVGFLSSQIAFVITLYLADRGVRGRTAARGPDGGTKGMVSTEVRRSG